MPQQPELNYRNPAVLEAMLGEMRFWLDKGVDGFRVDVIWLMIKDEQLRDEPPDPSWAGGNPHGSLLHIYTGHQPEVHGIVRAMRRLLDEYEDRMMVGEIYLPNDALVSYYGTQLDECHLPFNFQLINSAWGAQVVRSLVDAYEGALLPGAWPNWVLGNHDQRRIAGRVGRPQARVAQMLLLTLRGTPTCYYGDEIGMEDVPIPVHQMKDPQAVRQPEIAAEVGRDPQRTPMQWDASPHAGFTAAGVEPWLPVAPGYDRINVAVQEQDQTSMLAFFRALTALRRAAPALQVGDYRPLDVEAEHVFAYLRRSGEEQIVVAVNFGDEPRTLDLRGAGIGAAGTVVLSTGMDRADRVDLGQLGVRPNEGLIIRLE